jgi:hypothetical protein
MNSIVRWYRSNYTQITWFVIGWLAMVALEDFSKGNWAGVAWDLGLIWLNYIFYKNN